MVCYFSVIGNWTNSSHCKRCPEYVIPHGTTAYTNPKDNNFGPRQEGSQAIFSCDSGYQLSGSGYMTCKKGQWSGAIPGCEDIDECKDVDCGGKSKCTNGIGKYICECAKGWTGGGVNKTCELGHCKCTGNKGYWKAERQMVNGVFKLGYDHGPSYGEKCAAHDIEDSLTGDHDFQIANREPWYANEANCEEIFCVCLHTI